MIKDKIKKGKLTVGKTGIYVSAETEKGYALNLSFVNTPNLKTMGVSNITEDQMYILFMDFDNIKYKDLVSQLDFICTRYDVSHFLILRIGENKYHVISFEKLLLSELKDILENTLCDYSYKRIPIKLDKGYILRMYPKVDLDGKVIKPKPEYVNFRVCEKVLLRGISRPHLELFCRLYPQLKSDISGMLKNNEGKIDNFEGVKILLYGTSNKNFLHQVGLGDLLTSKRLIIEWQEESNGS